MMVVGILDDTPNQLHKSRTFHWPTHEKCSWVSHHNTSNVGPKFHGKNPWKNMEEPCTIKHRKGKVHYLILDTMCFLSTRWLFYIAIYYQSEPEGQNPQPQPSRNASQVTHDIADPATAKGTSTMGPRDVGGNRSKFQDFVHQCWRLKSCKPIWGC